MAWSRETVQLIESAVWEDLGADGDITSTLLDDPARLVTAKIVAREAGVIAGLALLPAILAAFNRRLETSIRCALPASGADEPAVRAGANRPPEQALAQALRARDGQPAAAGQVVATLSGPQGAVLTAERTVLNFLTRLSGVATLTRRYVDAGRAANPRLQVLDTRKTLPGWRELDKYAVRCGGGTNHRFGLYDAVLIKDNHLAGVPVDALAGWLEQRLRRLSATATPAFVEVEVDTLDQLRAVIGVAGVDIVLIDNFSLEQVRAAVAMRNELGRSGRPLLEVSGGVRLETVAALAATGVDRISIGALTHSAPGLDLGLDLD